MEDKDASHALVRLILLGVYTGTRTGAMRRLGWIPNTLGGHVDAKAGVIHRRGDDEVETKKRRPSIRIPDRLVGYLRRWREADMALNPPIAFVIHYRGKPVDKQRKSWDSARKGAGLPQSITPHILRHTAATWLMQAGADIWDAANYLGMSVKMLEDVYSHHHPDYQKDVASRVGKRR